MTNPDHADRQQRVEALFQRATTRPDAEREAFVRAEVVDDAIAQEVLARLAADRQDSTRQPTRIGPYRILDTLGEGGMGVVYLAEQQQPVKRRVALKLIKLGMDSK